MMKYLEINDNIANSYVNSAGFPDATMIYPINPWIFWYRDPTKLHSKHPWEESLIKIETVRDIVHLWKSVNTI